MLPKELQTPPPRDPKFAESLVAKNKKIALSCFVGGPIITGLVIGRLLMKGAELDTMSIAMGAGVGALVELFGVAMFVITQRSLHLFRNGIATTGKIRKAQVPADRNGNAYVLLQIEFKDNAGMVRLGQVSTFGKPAGNDLKEGAEVAVLFDPQDPNKIAIYSAAIGMASGVSKRAA